MKLGEILQSRSVLHFNCVFSIMGHKRCHVPPSVLLTSTMCPYYGPQGHVCPSHCFQYPNSGWEQDHRQAGGQDLASSHSSKGPIHQPPFGLAYLLSHLHTGFCPTPENTSPLSSKLLLNHTVWMCTVGSEEAAHYEDKTRYFVLVVVLSRMRSPTKQQPLLCAPGHTWPVIYLSQYGMFRV